MIGNSFSYGYYNYKYLTSTAQNLNKQLNLANYQLTTKKLARNYTDQTKASTFLRLKTNVANQDQYITNCKTAETRLTIIDTILSSIDSVAREARKAADVMSYNTEEHAFLSTFAKGSFQQVVDYLNTKADNGFVFSGLATGSRSVTFADAADSGHWSKLPADPLTSPNPALGSGSWGTQAIAIYEAAEAVVTANPAATGEDVLAALPANTPPDVVAAVKAWVAANPGTAANTGLTGVAGDIATAIDANVMTPLGSDLESYFTVVEDNSTSPPTYSWANPATGSRITDPDFVDYYYTGGSGVDPKTGKAVDGLSIKIDNESSVSTGYSAQETAFELILRGVLMLAQTPEPVDPSNPTVAEEAAYLFYANEAEKLISAGLTQLENVAIRNATSATIVSNKLDQLTVMQNINLDALDPLENADEWETAAKIMTLQNSLSATYTVISQLQNMSLLNYL